MTVTKLNGGYVVTDSYSNEILKAMIGNHGYLVRYDPLVIMESL